MIKKFLSTAAPDEVVESVSDWANTHPDLLVAWKVATSGPKLREMRLRWAAHTMRVELARDLPPGWVKPTLVDASRVEPPRPYTGDLDATFNSGNAQGAFTAFMGRLEIRNNSPKGCRLAFHIDDARLFEDFELILDQLTEEVGFVQVDTHAAKEIQNKYKGRTPDKDYDRYFDLWMEQGGRKDDLSKLAFDCALQRLSKNPLTARVKAVAMRTGGIPRLSDFDKPLRAHFEEVLADKNLAMRAMNSRKKKARNDNKS